MDTTIQNDNLSAPVTVPTKELPKATQIIKNVWNFFKSNFKVLWPIYFVIGLSEALNRITSDKELSKYLDNMGEVPSLLINLVSFVISILAIFFTIALFKSIFEIKNGQFSGVKNNLRYSVKRLWPYIVLTVVAGLAFIGSFALLVVPGLVLMVYLSFSVSVLFNEDKSPMESMLRSWSLIKEDALKVFSKSFTVFVILFIAYFIISLVVSTFATSIIEIVDGTSLIENCLILFILVISSCVISMISAPVSVIAMSEIYLAQKAIKGDVVVSEELNRNRKNKIIASSILGILIPIIIAVILIASK